MNSQSRNSSKNSSGDEKISVQVSLESIVPIVATLLDRCQVPYEVRPYDQALHDKCLAVAKERGYPISADHNSRSLLPFLPTGVYFSAFPYAHLPAESTRVFIALYSAFLTYLDDLYERELDNLILFHSRLVRHEKHGDPVLDGLTHLLAETDQHFDHVAANLIVTETLTYVNSLVLDHEVEGLNISKNAVGLPSFLRLLSGITFSYTMYIFPAEVSVKKYIQAIPEMRHFIWSLNDVMSFYKEETRGEADNVNFISLMSASQGLDKMSVLASLASDCAKSYENIKTLLHDEPDALQAWQNFVPGYICSHISDSRYGLDHLNL